MSMFSFVTLNLFTILLFGYATYRGANSDNHPVAWWFVTCGFLIWGGAASYFFVLTAGW